MFEDVFDEVKYATLDREIEAARKDLTPEIREELSAYSEEELVTTSFIAVCRKRLT